MLTKKTCLTEGSVWKGLISFAVPIMLSNFFQQLYNTVDSAVAGRFAGSEALAAVGSTGALLNLFIGFFLGISTGTGVVFATAYGAKDERRLKMTMDTALILSFFAGVFLTVFGVIWSRDMLELMDSPADVIDQATSYLRVYFSGSVFMMIYNIGAGIIQASGDSKRPLIYLVISGILNVICDIICVAGLGMGAAGAALATVFSQFIAAGLIVAHLMRVPEGWRLRPLKMKYDGPTARKIAKLAVPSGLQSCMFALSNILIQAKINAFGSVAMAGTAAYGRLDGFGYMPTQALGLSISTFVSQNIGAGNFKRLKIGVRVTLVYMLCSSLAVTSLIILFSRPLLGLFTDNPSVAEYGLMMMWRLAPFAVIFAMSEMLAGAVRGAGKVIPPTIIYACAICVFRIIWITVLLPIYPDIRLVFWCYPVSWSVCAVCMLIYFIKGGWRPVQAPGGVRSRLPLRAAADKPERRDRHAS